MESITIKFSDLKKSVEYMSKLEGTQVVVSIHESNGSQPYLNLCFLEPLPKYKPDHDEGHPYGIKGVETSRKLRLERSDDIIIIQ